MEKYASLNFEMMGNNIAITDYLVIEGIKNQATQQEIIIAPS